MAAAAAGAHRGSRRIRGKQIASGDNPRKLVWDEAIRGPVSGTFGPDPRQRMLNDRRAVVAALDERVACFACSLRHSCGELRCRLKSAVQSGAEVLPRRRAPAKNSLNRDLDFLCLAADAEHECELLSAAEFAFHVLCCREQLERRFLDTWYRRGFFCTGSLDHDALRPVLLELNGCEHVPHDEVESVLNSVHQGAVPLTVRALTTAIALWYGDVEGRRSKSDPCLQGICQARFQRAFAGMFGDQRGMPKRGQQHCARKRPDCNSMSPDLAVEREPLSEDWLTEDGHGVPPGLVAPLPSDGVLSLLLSPQGNGEVHVGFFSS